MYIYFSVPEFEPVRKTVTFIDEISKSTSPIRTPTVQEVCFSPALEISDGSPEPLVKRIVSAELPTSAPISHAGKKVRTLYDDSGRISIKMDNVFQIKNTIHASNEEK